MLFDLRGRGRRRMVKIVYITLAFLLGGGLVLFGIGGEQSGGLVDAITERGGGGDNTDDRAQANVDAAARKTQANPSDAAAWAELARARVRLASTGDNFDVEQNTYTATGLTQLRQADTAFKRYLDLEPEEIDDSLARLMVGAYQGLGQTDDAVRAQEVVTEARPDSAAQFAQLAVLAWQAGQNRKGDLARDKALELTEPDMRESLRGQLETAKNEAVSSAAQGAG